MLAQRTRASEVFTRRDATRLVMAAGVLLLVMTGILSLDILPTGYNLQVGDIAPAAIQAPRTAQFESTIETEQARQAARQAVAPQYDYTNQRAATITAQQLAAFDRTVAPVDAAFAAVLSDATRKASLAGAIPGLSKSANATLQGLSKDEWTTLRTEMRRTLATMESGEIRDTALAQVRASLPAMMDPSLSTAERNLAAEILSPLIVANSSYSATLTQAAQDSAAAAVQPVMQSYKQGEVIVDAGHPVTAVEMEAIQYFGLLNPKPDLAKLAGWLVLSALTVGLLLAWIWRFRPEFWHRNNALVLIGLLLVMATLALRLTAGRSVLPYFVPTAAVGLLLTVLLDSGTAVVVLATLAVLSGTVAGFSAELAMYVFLGGLAGIVSVRRGDRLHYFVQAGLAMALVEGAVIGIFGLLGEIDLTGVLQLWGASLVSAIGSAVAAVGSFAVLGNLFSITTNFQLLELANPSQPLLRRLLLETPGTYHHSLMVGNLAERAAEAIGADPLLARVAAYYHDIGKLANPLAYIENQGGGENVHDQLTPEESASVLKAHVASGIDLAYEYGLPKAIIAFIPQHHGTALMSYFYAKAQAQAVAEAGARPGSPEAAAAAAAVDQRPFRHAGPKPQSREAAILMLADGVEASVRSLSDQEEPTIRAMVRRIIRERLDDGQFDECDLTLRDLEHIRESFVAQLLGMYHRRIEYPQNKIVEIESRRLAGGTRG